MSEHSRHIARPGPHWVCWLVFLADACMLLVPSPTRIDCLCMQEGTRENPIPILSVESERIVGISLPVRRTTTAVHALCRHAYMHTHGVVLASILPLLASQLPLLLFLSAFALQDDAEIRWFTLKAGELAYDPDTSNFFALKKVSKAEVDEWVARAEKQVLGSK